jgi:hypothetical protein
MKKPKMKKPADCSASVVKLAVNNPTVTHDQMAAQDFEPFLEFVNLDAKSGLLERTKNGSARSRLHHALPSAY